MMMSEAPGGVEVTQRPSRKKSLEIQIPLIRREDRAGGDYFIGVEVDVDLGVNLADYVVMVLLGRPGAGAPGSGAGPRIILRPRDVEGDTRSTP